MDLQSIIPIALRWLHMVSAALVIGGIFFMRIILPMGLNLLDGEIREQVFLRCRRGFKMVIHPCILFLLISGVYNTTRLWSQYNMNKAVFHGLWGTHLLLGLIAIGISLWLLAGKQPPKSHRSWSLLNFLLLLVLVAIGSTLKAKREAIFVKPTVREIVLPQ
jgi:putative copper export protein